MGNVSLCHAANSTIFIGEIEKIRNVQSWHICLDDDFCKNGQKSRCFNLKYVFEGTELPMPKDEDWYFMHFRAVDWCDAHPELIPIRKAGGDYVGHF